MATLMLTAWDVPELPAESVASAVNEWMPLTSVVVSSEALHVAAAQAMPTLLPSIFNCTVAIASPEVGVAVAETVRPADTVEFVTGAVMETDGEIEATGLSNVTAQFERSLP